MTTMDAVVIGAGPNGLVAANLLVDAGWSVTLLEEQPHPGGAVWSDGGVAPGYVHDTFSSFYPLAAASPTIRGLRLEEHGTRVGAGSCCRRPLVRDRVGGRCCTATAPTPRRAWTRRRPATGTPG